MLETVLVSISCALSVCAAIGVGVALKVSDPLKLRRILSEVSGMDTDFRNRLTNIEDVLLPQVEARTEAILDRAELKFDSAEAKRKSVAARERHAGNRAEGDNGGDNWLDESLSRGERAAAIERFARSR